MAISFDDYDLRLVDKYLSSVNVYWSSLITVNGLLLTFFSIDTLSLNGQIVLLNYPLIACCIISLWFLIWNFGTVKST